MVRSCDKSQWPIEDSTPRYSSRWKEKGQAEKKKWTDNIAEWTGKSVATTQALDHDHQRWRQGRALPQPKPLTMTIRGGDREELCHNPSP